MQGRNEHRAGPQSPLSGQAPPQGGGRICPVFTVFIPKNRKYLAQLSDKKIWGTKSFKGGAKMAIRGAKLTFGGGKKFGSKKAPGGTTSL